MTDVGNARAVFDVLAGTAADGCAAERGAEGNSCACSWPDDEATVPWVGEVHAYRAFRMTADGLLSSLSTSQTWSPGTNTAGCRSSRCAAAAAGRPPPAAACSCGLYACSTIVGAERFAPDATVIASVACWGRVVADEAGVRAQYARIDGIWLSRRVTAETVSAVRRRYPSTPIYRSQSDLTGHHPASVLDFFGPRPRLRGEISGGVAGRTLLAASLLLGGLPAQWIRGHNLAMNLWVVAFLLCCAAGIVNARNRGEPIRAGRKLTYAAVALWLLAPFAGPVMMWLLRLPALEIVVLSTLKRRRATRSRRLPGGVRSFF